ncbi:glutathione ABC transporter substrate-binding protein [Shouchella shacheensis]|uniref:glutathione ABC transporter substrate-binding protein n=1 Tax=Shouchella shacheensis TaxID=1649580 RepID=UPI00073FC090|nr:glutathione ABC transporter substrate-binding protein [Shouchella shacheensis]
MFKRSRFIYPVGVALILAGCASEPEESEEATSTPSPETEDELAIAIGSDIISLDPQGANDLASSNVNQNMFDTLVTLNMETQEAEPNLAEEWEEIDETTWEFTLRDDVTFHDGSSFTADDVKATFDRINDPDVASPRANLFTTFEEVEVMDETTVRIHLEHPFAPLFNHLAHAGASILSEEQIEADYELMEEGSQPSSVINAEPIGTGPFVYESWVSNESIALTRNDDYWGDMPHFASVLFEIIPDEQTQVAELQAGGIDMMESTLPNQVAELEAAEGIDVIQQTGNAMFFLGLHTQKEPLDNTLVRQAIAHAIDKQEIISGVLEDNATEANSPLTPAVFGYDDSLNGHEFDPDRSRELLEEAGYADGFEIELWIDGDQQRQDIAVILENRLGDVGIEVDIQTMEWGTYVDQTTSGLHEMFLLSWTSSTLDADQSMTPLFGEESALDRFFLEDDEFESMLQGARRETDEGEREAIYAEMQQWLEDEAPIVPFFYADNMFATRDTLANVHKLPNNLIDIPSIERVDSE